MSYPVTRAAKLDEAPVARALDDSPIMYGDGGIDQIAAKGSQTGQNAVFVGAVSREYPTTSETKIAAILRIPTMARPHAS
jgi:hypothetical protein